MYKVSIIIDYNGKGKWSQAKIKQRYDQYSHELNIVQPLDINSYEHIASGKKWIYPVVDKIIIGIEKNDEACKIIGVELVEESQTMPFGRTLKSNTARALRRTVLNESLQQRLRKRIVSMLIAGNVPREYKEYAKLLRKLGIDQGYWQDINNHFPNKNKYAMKYYNYFKSYANINFYKIV